MPERSKRGGSPTRRGAPAKGRAADGATAEEARTDAVQEADDLAPAMPAPELRESYQRAVRDAAEGRVRRFSSVGALKQWLDE